MRILFVHQHLGAFGGAEANIHLTASELRRRGHAVGLMYRRGTGRSEEGWRTTFSHCFQLATDSAVEGAQEIVEYFTPDLIYLHTLADLPVLSALLNSGVPVVRMVHDHEMYCMRGYKYNYFTRNICTRAASPYCVFPCLASIERNRNGVLPIKWASYLEKRREIKLNQRCHHFVVYSEYSRQELVRNGFDPGKISIQVPIRCWGEGPVSSFSDRNLLLFVGQIIRGKGVDVLLQALAQVKAPFECLILGDGNHRAHCERLSARLGLNDRVDFRGYVLREELKQFYLDASVFVVSSVWPEPFGMVGPEAMRYGLPVVGFDAGGIREWLTDGENGFLVPWMDTAAFAARVDQLLRDKSLARSLGRNGLERVNREYDATHQVAALEALFQRILDPSRAETKEPCALSANHLYL